MHPGPVLRARPASLRTVLPVVAAALLLGACTATDGGDGGGGTAAAPTPVAPSTTEQTQDPGMTDQPAPVEPSPGGDPDVLTEQDSGSRLTLALGEERSLRLGSAWSWTDPVVDGSAVTLTPVDYLVDPGYVEWLVTGSAAGSAVLEVVGEPVCGDTTVCPPTTVTLDVEVTG